VISVCVFLFRGMDRQILAAGPFFEADAAGGWLSLPRLGLRFDRADVLGFVEVRAWHTVRYDDGSSSERLGEVSVLVRGPGGEVHRHPVATALRVDVVGRVGRRLAELFQVECRPSR